MWLFVTTLVLIFVIGVAIAQFAILNWTDGYMWSLLHIALILVSIIAILLLIQKVIQWAVFPYNAKIITSSHHRDLNL